MSIEHAWLNSGFKDIIYAISFRVKNEFDGHLKLYPPTFGKIRTHDKNTIIETTEAIITLFNIKFTYSFEKCDPKFREKIREQEIKNFETNPYVPFRQQWSDPYDYYTFTIPDDWQNNQLLQKQRSKNRALYSSNKVYEKIISVTKGSYRLNYQTDINFIIDKLLHTKRHFTYCGSTAWLASFLNVPTTVISQDSKYMREEKMKDENLYYIDEKDFLRNV